MTFQATAAQRIAIEHVGGDLLLSASAGSGKTAVLAERVAFLICDIEPRAAIDRMLIVTFTRAAAAEMRERVARVLRERLASEGDPDAVRHIREQLVRLGAAEICTIDAFCGRVLREFFDQAGVDPAFSVLREQDAKLLRETLLDELMRWAATADDPRAVQARLWFKARPKPDEAFLRTMIAELHMALRRMCDPDAWRAAERKRLEQGPAALGAEALEVMAAALAKECALQSGQLSALERLAAHERLVSLFADYRSGLEQIQQLVHEGRARAALEAIADLRPPQVPRLKGIDREVYFALKDKWFRKRIGAVFATATKPSDEDPHRKTVWRDVAQRAARHADWLRLVLELEAMFAARLQESKATASVLEFDDVLRRTLRLLESGEDRGPSAVAVELRDRFDHIFVDEAQDTNGLQLALFAAIARPAPRGNRFLVGDVKQSIYAFRNAEPALFIAEAEALRGDAARGRVLRLADSFRSHAGLIDGLNAMFTRLFDGAFGGSDYGPDEALAAQRADVPNPTLDAEPRIAVHSLTSRPRRDVEDDVEESNSDAVADADAAAGAQRSQMQREASCVVEEIRRLRAAGVRIPSRNAAGATELRALRYSDIAILLRAASGKATQAAQVLRDAGIPCVADGRDSLLDSREVQDLRNVLQLLVNRRDDVALAGFLRGPFVGLKEPALAAIRGASRGPFWGDVRSMLLDDVGKDADWRAMLRHACGRLDCWERLARTAELPELIRAIIRETDLESFAGALPGAAHRLALLGAFEQYAADFAAGADRGLAEFVAHLDELERNDARIESSTAIADDVVRIMTIHGAKGLEFPIVFVLDAGRSFSRGSRSASLLADEHLGAGLQSVDMTPPDELAPGVVLGARRLVLANQSYNRSLEEELRLLYVAATRAREALVIVGHLSAARREQIQALQSQADKVPLIDRLSADSTLEWVLRAVEASGGEQATWVRTESHDERAFGAAPQAIAAIADRSANDGATVEVESFVAGQRAFSTLRGRELPAVITASGAKRAARRPADADSVRTLDGAAPLRRPLLAPEASVAPAGGTALGTAYHLLLEHMPLPALASAAEIEAQIADLVERGVIARDAATAIEVGDLVWLGRQPLGRALAAAAPAALRREWSFAYAYPVLRRGEAEARDHILLRGAIDCVLVANELTLIDYKSDRPVGGADLASRLADYMLQMQLYGVAARAILQAPVARLALVWLRRRTIDMVPVEDPALEVLLAPQHDRAAGAR